jgi:hypothetical protein
LCSQNFLDYFPTVPSAVSHKQFRSFSSLSVIC